MVLQVSEDADFSETCSTMAVQDSTIPGRGDRVQMFWPLDDTYYSGTIKTTHKNGEVTVLYDDGIKERLQMDNKVWKYYNHKTTANAEIIKENNLMLKQRLKMWNLTS